MGLYEHFEAQTWSHAPASAWNAAAGEEVSARAGAEAVCVDVSPDTVIHLCGVCV